VPESPVASMSEWGSQSIDPAVTLMSPTRFTVWVGSLA
jgi:hypothetical protein